jgi:hypothetical protein
MVTKQTFTDAEIRMLAEMIDAHNDDKPQLPAVQVCGCGTVIAALLLVVVCLALC